MCHRQVVSHEIYGRRERPRAFHTRIEGYPNGFCMAYKKSFRHVFQSVPYPEESPTLPRHSQDSQSIALSRTVFPFLLKFRSISKLSSTNRTFQLWLRSGVLFQEGC